MSVPGSAMCALCGFGGPMDADVDESAGLASALAFAVHFAAEHPDVTGGVSRYLVMVPTDETKGTAS